MSAFDLIAAGRTARLAEAALEFSMDRYPDLAVQDYVEHLHILAEAFDIYLAGESREERVLSRLNDFFFKELAFNGNTDNYYDPRNSYLNQVLDRRLGIPITLAVVYQDLARSAGLPLAGINLPGHFMLAYPLPTGERLYIDVFHQGERLSWEGCAQRIRPFVADEGPLDEAMFLPMSDREILVRMLRNLKSIYSRGDLTQLLRVQERISALLPHSPTERRDLGILYYHLSKPMLAMHTLDDLLRRHADFDGRATAENYLARATREAVQLN